MLRRSLGLPALLLCGLVAFSACGDKDEDGSSGDGGADDGGAGDGGSGSDGGANDGGSVGDGGSIGDGGAGDGGTTGDGGDSSEDDCDNDTDDDSDGLVDCDDPDCAADAACIETECNDGIDDEGDGLTDCEDPDCLGNPWCPELDCDNGEDDDADGYADCLDADCLDAEACNDPELECDDGIDNDEDGRTDCEDSDCGLAIGCYEYICDDDADDDDDGLFDCADPDCFGEDACIETVCDDGIDDDGDGGTDCSDVDCWYTTTCMLAECADAELDPDASGEVWSGSTSDATDDFSDLDSCGEYDALDVGLIWEIPADGCYEVGTDGSDFDTVVRVYDSCRTDELTCDDDSGEDKADSFLYVEGDEGDLRIIVIDGATASESGDAVLNINEYEYPYDVDIGSATGDAAEVGDIDGLEEELRALPSCAYYSQYDDLLLWTAPSDGTYTFDLSESEFDTVLGLYRVGDQCPEEIGCNDDEDYHAKILTSWLQVELEEGNQVLIWIGGYDGTELGDWQLDITLE